MIRNGEFIDPYICRIDPVTLTGLALGALTAGGGAIAAGALGKGSPAVPTPAAPASPPPPQQQPQGQNIPKPQTPTFIGAAATPPTQSGQKTLLGQ